MRLTQRLSITKDESGMPGGKAHYFNGLLKRGMLVSCGQSIAPAIAGCDIAVGYLVAKAPDKLA